MNLYTLIAFILLFRSSVATRWTPIRFYPIDIALQACNAAIGEVAMVCSSAGGGHMAVNTYCRCGEEAGFGSFADCLVRGYGSNSLIDDFIDYCKTNTGIEMDRTTFWQNYSKAMENEILPSEVNDTMTVLKYPVSINLTEFEVYKEYYQKRRNNNNVSIYYGYGMLAYWGAIVLCAAIFHWTKVLFPSVVSVFVGPFSNACRRYFTLRATYKKYKTKDFDLGLMLIPSRFELVVVFLFYLLSAVCNGVGMVTVVGNKVVPNVAADINLRVAIRTGFTVLPVFPLLVLFAGRNNFLIWLTGWNQSTFITYHKWIGICLTLLIIIHSITFSLYYLILNSYMENMKPKHVVWGIVSTIFGSFMLGQSLLVFRRRSYELFLLLHHLFAFFYMLAGYKHIDLYGDGNDYVAAFALWAIEKIARLIRILRFMGAPKAKVLVLTDETLKLVIPKPKSWHPPPGGYAYIYFLRPTCFWQSHPFSFADCKDENYLHMYIKVKGGMSHGLYQYLHQFPDKTAEIRVAVEGPYANRSKARNYKNALFLAGGNGVPGIHSECIDLARKRNTGRSKFVWVIREWQSLVWFHEELASLLDYAVEVTVYVTQPESTRGFDQLAQLVGMTDKKAKDAIEEKELISTDQEEELIQKTIAYFPHVNFMKIRPDMETLIKKSIMETDGSLAVVTCGPAMMVDDVREAICINLHESQHRVDFFEQLQVWT